MSQVRTLTWNRTASLITLVFFSSIALGIWLASQRVFLSPPFLGYTFYFYALVGAAPPLIALLIYVRGSPTGSRFRLMLFSLVIGAIFIFYLALINPGLYSSIECSAASRSGMVVHQECICKWAGSSDAGQVACSSDSFFFLPLVRLNEHR
jgi:hypothetical protein